MFAAAITARAWDHPRMGGEKSVGPEERPGVQGSPPHGRGKDPFAVHYFPASEDHPRMGGEKGQGCGWYLGPIGSPPHGRGKDVHVLHAVADLGITPAWAGKRYDLA